MPIMDSDDLLRLYRQLLLIRRFEEKSAEMYALAKIAGFLHLYIGEEAIDRSLRFMASLGGPGSRLIFDFSDYVLGPDWAPEKVRHAGFTGFTEVAFDELWRRHLPGEPSPSARIVKLGIASR